MSTSHWLDALKSWFSGGTKRPVLQAVQAASGGSRQRLAGTLDPQAAINGARVTVPAAAEIFDDEPVWLQWAEPGGGGDYRTDIRIPPLNEEEPTIDFLVPSEYIRWHIGKSLIVLYEVLEQGVVEPHKSVELQLTVSALPSTAMHPVQSQQISGNQLSLSALGSGGALFSLAQWPLIATGQLLTVEIVGVALAGGNLTIPVLTAQPVSQLLPLIPAGSISKASLRQFKVPSPLTIRAWVSFDGNQTRTPFRNLTPQLVA
jgi:hypothetical protein